MKVLTAHVRCLGCGYDLHGVCIHGANVIGWARLTCPECGREQNPRPPRRPSLRRATTLAGTACLVSLSVLATLSVKEYQASRPAAVGKPAAAPVVTPAPALTLCPVTFERRANIVVSAPAKPHQPKSGFGGTAPLPVVDKCEHPVVLAGPQSRKCSKCGRHEPAKCYYCKQPISPLDRDECSSCFMPFEVEKGGGRFARNSQIFGPH